MKYRAEIDIMPHPELLDPQGKTVSRNMKHIDIHGVENARIGKHIELELEAGSEEEAREMTENACKKLLANVITETYTYEVSEA